MKKFNLLILIFFLQITTNAQHLTQAELFYDQILRAHGSSMQKENDLLYKSMLKDNEESRLERQRDKYNSEQYRKYEDLIKGIPASKYEVKYYYSKYNISLGVLTQYLLLINKQYGKYSFYTFDESDMFKPYQNLIIFIGGGDYKDQRFENFKFYNREFFNSTKLNFQYIDGNQNFVEFIGSNVCNVLYRVPFFNSDTSKILKTKAESLSSFSNIYMQEKGRITNIKSHFKTNPITGNVLKIGNYYHGGVIFEMQNDIIKIVSLFDQCNNCHNDFKTNNSIIFNHKEFFDDSAIMYHDWTLPTKEDLIKIKKNTSLLLEGDYWTSKTPLNRFYYYFNPNSNIEGLSAYPLYDKHKIRAVRVENGNSQIKKNKNDNSNNIDNKLISFYEYEDRVSRIYWRGIDSISSLKNKFNDSLFNIQKRQNDSIREIEEFNDSLKLLNFQELKMKLEVGDVFEKGIVFDIDKLNKRVFLVSRLLDRTNNINGEVESIRSRLWPDWDYPSPEFIKKIIILSMGKENSKFIEFDERFTKIWSDNIWSNSKQYYNNLYKKFSSDGNAFCLFVKII